MRLVRIIAAEEVRVARGFVFTPGIDDAPTECDLDDVSPDFTLSNPAEGDPPELPQLLSSILNWSSQA